MNIWDELRQHCVKEKIFKGHAFETKMLGDVCSIKYGSSNLQTIPAVPVDLRLGAKRNGFQLLRGNLRNNTYVLRRMR